MEEDTVQAIAEPHTPPTDLAPDLDGLFEEHAERVYRVAYRVTGNPDDAEDALQTVFLRLARRDEALDPGRGVAGYLHRAAVNAALDLLRSRRRGPSVSLDDSTAEPVDRALPGPERSSRDGELRRLLRQGLSRLAPQAAEIFVLRYLEGYDNREIARLLDMTPGAVAVSLHRSRGRLQKELAPLRGGV